MTGDYLSQTVDMKSRKLRKSALSNYQIDEILFCAKPFNTQPVLIGINQHARLSA